MAPSTAEFMSASSNIMNGALPPSSKLTFFSVPVANFASILPTLVEPVKLILRTKGLVASSVAASRFLVGHTWIAVGGMPASTASLVKAKQVYGVSLGGLMTTVHPAARAGPTFLVIMAAGKFQGVIMPHTPTGSRIVITVVREVEDGIVTPYALVASSANQAMKLAAYTTSPKASGYVFPFSRLKIVATVQGSQSPLRIRHQVGSILSSLFAIIKSFHFLRRVPREVAVVPSK
jgi:hypothetical protein